MKLKGLDPLTSLNICKCMKTNVVNININIKLKTNDVYYDY